MPAAGRKPKDRKVTRHRMIHDWVEVEDVPYSGPVPLDLPATRPVVTKDGTRTVEVDPAARDWWEDVVRMPHCVLWSQTDWRFALTTALVADLAAAGAPGMAAELRLREKILGLTGDARRDLRIRYVPAGSLNEKRPKAEAVKVDDLSARRARLAS